MSSQSTRHRSRQKNTRKSSRLLVGGRWLGGFFVAVVYVFVFYYFFVGPTGFRWRAIYGDVTYPEGEGFEIQGIDISHYQGTID